MSKIRADQYTNRAGTGAPTFSSGLNVTGVVTATSFGGSLTGNADTATLATNAQGLTGTPDITVNNLIAGVVTATSFSDASGSIKGIGIATAGGTVGTGVTLIDFRNSGISTVTVSSGIATVEITGGGGGGGLNAVNFVLSI